MLYLCSFKRLIMNIQDIKDLLAASDIRPTQVRILLYETIANWHNTFSLSDLENRLLQLDKSSIFRTLTLFHEHHLIHHIDDGSGSMKYCICHNHGHCTPEESHIHFHCEMCGRTFCIENQHVPSISIPEGFIINKINCVIDGICTDCASKQKR